MKIHRPRFLGIPRPLARALRMALHGSAMSCLMASPALAELPVAAANWVHSGSFAGGAPVISGSTMTITQTSERGILNWDSFNVGRDDTVDFRQPSASSSTLNRVLGASADPSRILGRINANGQVMIINRNGVVFGSGAQVNVGGLVASTLDISDDVFNSIGLLGALDAGVAAFEGEAARPDAEVRVERDARLAATGGEDGRVMLIAPRVVNDGDIEAPDGQVLLIGARDKVYFAQLDENSTALLVEVGEGGEVTNLHDIVADRGDITLAGLAVNQRGLVRASTAINVNGSIHLVARDHARVQSTGSDNQLVAGRAGTLVLGGDSTTEVALDTGRLKTGDPADGVETAIDGQKHYRSRIQVEGGQILMESGSTLRARNGEIRLEAFSDPAQRFASAQANDSSIRIERGASIDVSGADDAVLPMEANMITVSLRGNQLADAPLQKNGPLRGREVRVDRRRKTPLANIGVELDGIERSLAERAARGGSVTLASEGELRVDAGATVDISGGKVRYQGGLIDTSWLITRDGLVNISEARPDVEYLGVFGQFKVAHEKWAAPEVFNTFGGRMLASFEPGYVEGADAGELVLKAPSIRFQADLRAQAVTGRNQRHLPGEVDGLLRPWDQLPLGGRLVVGDEAAFVNGRTDLFGVAAVSLGDAEITAPQTFNVSRELLRDSGISRLAVYTSDRIEYAADNTMTFAPGADIRLGSGNVLFDGSLRSAAGQVTLEARDTRSTVLAGDEPQLRFGEQALIDVSGQWVNDNVDVAGGLATAPLAIDAGAVRLRARGDLLLATGGRVSANAGARLPAGGSQPEVGRAGAIELVNSDDTGAGRTLLGAALSAYGFDTGGSLAVTAGGFRIGGPARSGEIALDPGFFTRGGFSRYALTATTGGVFVDPGVHVAPRQDNLLMRADSLSTLASGTSMSVLASIERRPDLLRAPTDLALTLHRNSLLRPDARVELGDGASIDADPGASVRLASDSNLWLFGAIDAPAGDIDLELVASSLQRAFDPAQSLWLGADSSIGARAIPRVYRDELGRPVGEVLDGGRISIDARRGFLVAEQGSRIDVSGAAAQVSLVGEGSAIDTLPRPVAGAGGRIELSAADGMILDGELRGQAARGVAGAAAGSLRVAVDTGRRGGANDPSNPGLRFPMGARILEVEQDFAPRLDGRRPGDALLSPDQVAALGGTAGAVGVDAVGRISVEQIEAGGFDSVELAVRPVSASNAGGGQRVRLGDGVELGLKRALRVEAPVLEASAAASVLLQAPYVALGPFSGGYAFHPDNSPRAGDASLAVQADLVDLGGDLVLDGFADSRFASGGDIRLRGVRAPQTTSFDISGSLRSAGDITLSAAQVYPTTATDYRIETLGTASRVRFESGNRAAELPLSAGGRLSVRAPFIEQAGVLRAPFGDLDLRAGTRLTLAEGSETSVTGNGLLVPYGQTELKGKDWVLNFGPLTRVLGVGPDDPDSAADGRPPFKRVRLDAPAIEVSPGASLDVRGGGDLLAWEFQPGPGGSRDILDNAAGEGAFAILPFRDSLFAPVDPIAGAGFEHAEGDTISLHGGPGLPQGEFAVLPARYALLPGAWLVTPQPGLRDVVPGQALARSDGIALVAGRRGAAGAGIHESRWSAYALESGEQWRQRAAYLESRASTFFADQARALERFPGELPQDAGSVQFIAGSRLRLQGDLRGAAPAGRSARVDISADRLAVVETSGGGAGDRVEILASDLRGFGAESLLLGGQRQDRARGQAVKVSADSVDIDSGVSLEGPELLLVARDRVTVADAASLRAAGGAVRGADTLLLEGDGALLRLSTGAQVNVDRERVTGVRGELLAAPGSSLFAQRSMTLDATADSRVQGDLAIGPGGSLNLGARRISLGDSTQPVEGLHLDNGILSALQVSELILTSRSTLDLLGDVSFGLGGDGEPLLDRLTIRAAGIDAFGGTGESVLAARQVSLSNPNDETFVHAPHGVSPASGSLRVEARDGDAGSLLLGDGRFGIKGYTHTRLAGSGELRVQGDAQLDVDGDLTLSSARLAAAAGVDGRIGASGRLRTTAGAPRLPAAQALGAQLTLHAAQILHGGRIELPGGRLRLEASDELRLADGSRIDLSGRALAFPGQTLYADAGRLELRSTSGDLFLDAGSRVDLSAAGSSDAGELELSAVAGRAYLDGDLSASHGPEGEGGRLGIEVARMDDLPTINAVLDQAGFDAARRLRIGQGDVTTGDARARTFELYADNGAIVVDGRIDASGAQGGRVRLDAGAGLRLEAGAELDASAQAAAARGGEVVLRSRDASLNLAAGAVIDVAGRDAAGERADNGVVRLVAPRQGSGVAIDTLAAQIRGAREVRVEAHRRSTAARVDAALIRQLQRETEAYMTGNTALAGLGVADDPRFHLLPSLEVFSDAALDLAADWQLDSGNGWVFDGEPGVLTLRAATDLRIDADLDGLFTELDAFGLERLMGRGPMWSLQLEAERDINVGAGRRVRTGTGFISARAGRNITFGSGASLYSAGENAGGGTLDTNLDLLLLPGAITDNGGDVRLAAGASIEAAAVAQLSSDWQPRLGGTLTGGSVTGEVPTAWSVLFDAFGQHVGALGGGEVEIRAGADIDNLSVAVATSGRPAGSGSVEEQGFFQFASRVFSNRVDVLGGGRLQVEAGGDIAGGLYHLGAGEARLRAGGALVDGDNGLAPILSLGESRFDVQARNGLRLETALNSTLVEQTLFDPFFGAPLPKSLFASYGSDPERAAGLALSTLAGDLVLSADAGKVSAFHGVDERVATLFPGSLTAQSLQGDLVLERGFTLFPAVHGDLGLLAAGSITTGKQLQRVTLNQSDADPALLPGLQRPVSILDELFERRLTPTLAESHAVSPLHGEDPQAARIVARDGDIAPDPATAQRLSLFLAEPVTLSAGRDLSNLELVVQHNRADDTSLVRAGRDIVMPTRRGKVTGNLVRSDARIEVSGPGRLDLQAGRDIDFGSSRGLASVGNEGNGFLPEGGASLTLLAGLSPSEDYAPLFERLSSDPALGTFRNALLQFARDRLALREADDEAVLAAVRDMNPVKRNQAIFSVLFDLVRQAGVDGADGGSFEPGYQAIEAVFPDDTARQGGIRMLLSQVTTLDGGDVNLLAPRGGVDAGVASTGQLGDVSSDQLGVIIQGKGSVSALVRDDFLVNATRVFAQDGGDILIWSSLGDIDAGSGANLSGSVPEKQVSFDTFGNVSVRFPPAVASAGIRSFVMTRGRKAGNVFLFAPQGTINAGDAGIATAGNLTLAATRVLGADNIQVGGVSVGVPAGSSAPPPGLAGASALSASVSKSAEAVTSGGEEDGGEREAVALMSVEVLGFGEPQDVDDDGADERRRKRRPVNE